MSQKDEAVGKVIRLLEQCQAASFCGCGRTGAVIEIGPYGVVYSRADECPHGVKGHNRSTGYLRPVYETHVTACRR